MPLGQSLECGRRIARVPQRFHLRLVAKLKADPLCSEREQPASAAFAAAERSLESKLVQRRHLARTSSPWPRRCALEQRQGTQGGRDFRHTHESEVGSQTSPMGMTISNCAENHQLGCGTRVQCRHQRSGVRHLQTQCDRGFS